MTPTSRSRAAPGLAPSGGRSAWRSVTGSPGVLPFPALRPSARGGEPWLGRRRGRGRRQRRQRRRGRDDRERSVVVQLAELRVDLDVQALRGYAFPVVELHAQDLG